MIPSEGALLLRGMPKIAVASWGRKLGSNSFYSPLSVLINALNLVSCSTSGRVENGSPDGLDWKPLILFNPDRLPISNTPNNALSNHITNVEYTLPCIGPTS